MSQYKEMDDKYLVETYVPDVYQKSIFNIDYDQLKKAGIKLISFDIDDTIAPIEKVKPSKASITLFEKLKLMGFELFLMSNANYKRATLFGEMLNVDAVYRVNKPSTIGFISIQKKYFEKFSIEIAAKEMAHIGNSMVKDVATGKSYGVITCLVRDVGLLPKTGRRLNPFQTEGQKVRAIMKKRGLWRKHHLKEKGDQYYQLGETPKYLR